MCTEQYPFQTTEDLAQGRFTRIDPNINTTLQSLIGKMLQPYKEMRPTAMELLSILNQNT